MAKCFSFSIIMSFIRSLTYIPHISFKEEILKLICDCDVESAFIKALGARDVSYVIMVCQMLDGTCAGELFESGCLGGHVVFPLIQQLCHDLTVDTEIKIR